MVQPRIKVAAYFAVFVLPALLLYAVFFLYPFAQGIRISFTNWDGLTPRTPISMPKAEFESRILTKVASTSDRAFLLRTYRLDTTDNRYKRQYVTGGARYTLQRILRRIGYEPDSYRVVGFANYAQIFAGKVEQRFYPHMFTKTSYNADSDLPVRIPREDYERSFLKNLSAPDRAFASQFYTLEKDAYVLKPGYEELGLEDRIWLLPEIDTDKTVASEAVDAFISSVKTAGLSKDGPALEALLSAFLRDNRFSADGAAQVRAATQEIFSLGEMKEMLARNWVERKFEMGVVGFTLSSRSGT